MKKTEDPSISELLRTNQEALQKLHDIVENTIKEENLIVQNLLNPPNSNCWTTL